MAGYKRVDRLSEEIQREVDEIIRHDLRDPRIDGMWSITRAEVTGDLRYAKIYVSCLEDEKRTELLAALKHAAGMIRRELGRRMKIRYIPELLFISDENIAYGVHIAAVLKEVIKDEEREEEHA
ncbi:MAG: 30S ribosome-binding factor RbfA [Clostridia bacterium]|nr:30S ribosome-binding factor RbfA [Clostridia bacterium]